MEVSKLTLRLSNNKFAIGLAELVLGNFQVELNIKDIRAKTRHSISKTHRSGTLADTTGWRT